MAYEDFTTYTETDPLNKLTITANKIEMRGVSETTPFRVYKDFTADHFANFTHYFKITFIDLKGDETIILTSLSNTLADDYTDFATNNDAITTHCYYRNADFMNRYTLGDTETDNTDWYSGFADGFIGYMTFTRVGTTLTIQIYSDATKLILVDTISITGTANTRRYLYMCIWRNSGDNSGTDIDIENYDLNESTPTSTDKNIPHFFKSQFVTHH